jgi:hypothetical protein
MYRLTNKAFTTLIVVVIFAMSGCSHTTNTATSSGSPLTASPNRPAENDKYSQEIVNLNQLIQKNSKSSATKEAHYKLARLYSDHNNGNRNYQKALKHLQTYIRMDDSKVNGDTLNWLASLKEINRLSKRVGAQNREIGKIQSRLKQSKKENSALTRTNHKLRREEISLRDKARKLEESNLKLRKTIEMLKNLDQRLEEKRRNYNN